MYYAIYKITNQIDGKIYIGSHKTKDLNDNYMGSGKYLKNAQKKYGLDNFKKEILFVYDTPEAMYAKEAELVNEEFLTLENTYNLKVGGYGGWDYINNDTEFMLEKNRKGRKSADKVIFEKYGVKNSSQIPHVKDKLAKAFKRRIENGWIPPTPPLFTGKKHTDESKAKMRISRAGKQVGILNSQYGTMWITNGTINSKIKKGESIPEGYRPGKVQKVGMVQ